MIFYFLLVFAQRFLDRVEETFINENEHHKFSEFIDILRNFSENQTQHSGADFYLVRNRLFYGKIWCRIRIRIL